jgi:hypothetical protein
MEGPEELISQAEAAVKEAESTFGAEDVRTSYKLDELAAVLKANNHLLEAANISARARAIRSAGFAKESTEQEEKFGNASSGNQRMTAAEWLGKMHRFALIASAILFVITVLVPASGPYGSTTKNLIGSALAGVFLQLLLFPIKSLPRAVKWAIVIVGSGAIATVLFR